MRRFESTVLYLTWRQKREAEKARTASENPAVAERSAENVTAMAENVRESADTVDVVSQYLENLSPGSRRTMQQSLTVIASILSERTSPENVEWHRLTSENVTAIRGILALRYQPATANKMLSALRGVLRVCHQAGWMSERDYREAVSVSNLGTKAKLSVN